MIKTRFQCSLKVTAVVALSLSVWATGAKAEEIMIGGTGAALGTMQMLADAYTKQQSDVSFKVLPSLGSGGGIKAMLANSIQVAVSARPLNAAETQAGAASFEYGSTPFVFVTPRSTKADGITTQNLVDIYAGKLNQWPDGGQIRLVMRPIGDSDSEIIKNISPAMRDAKSLAEQRKGMLFTVTDQETVESIETTPGALGPSTLALVLSEKRALKVLALDGVVPDAKSIADGTYPLFKRMYIVTGPKLSPAAQGFVKFVGSPAGRDILTQTGHWVK